MKFDITKQTSSPIVTHIGNGTVNGTIRIEIEGYDPREVIREMIKEHGGEFILDITTRLANTSTIHTIMK